MIMRLVPLLTLLAPASSHLYSLGLCRPYLTKQTFKQPLVLDGEFSVLFTSGLKQLKAVSCATLGFSHNSTAAAYTFHTSVRGERKVETLDYAAQQLAPGSFLVTSPADRDSSVLYVKYYGQDIILLYWCKDEGDDNYYNNIWILAAKRPVANTRKVKRAILEMLYHDDYKGIIDRDMEDARNESKKYVQLMPCD